MWVNNKQQLFIAILGEHEISVWYKWLKQMHPEERGWLQHLKYQKISNSIHMKLKNYYALCMKYRAARNVGWRTTVEFIAWCHTKSSMLVTDGWIVILEIRIVFVHKKTSKKLNKAIDQVCWHQIREQYNHGKGIASIPILIVAWREITSGDSGWSFVTSSLLKSCSINPRRAILETAQW
jgi:hypothetical protein